MNATIGDPNIETSEQFHKQIAAALSFPHYYGKNLDALWDVLLSIERPSELVWLDSAISRKAMGGDFESIVALFRDVAQYDEERSFPAFSLILR